MAELGCSWIFVYLPLGQLGSDTTLGGYCCFSQSVVSDSFATPWTVAHQAPLSMGFPMQEYWRGLLFPSPGHLPNLGMEPMSPAWQVDSLPLSHLESPTGEIKVNK